MKKITRFILMAYCITFVASMAACGDVADESSENNVKQTDSEIVTLDSQDETTADSDDENIVTIDFSDINGFGVSKAYGNPSGDGRYWDIDGEEAVEKFAQLLDESLNYEVTKEEAESQSVAKGTPQWEISDGKKYKITVRQSTTDTYNLKINKSYYNVPEELMTELCDLVTAQQNS